MNCVLYDMDFAELKKMDMQVKLKTVGLRVKRAAGGSRGTGKNC
jgi:hypothetical protein